MVIHISQTAGCLVFWNVANKSAYENPHQHLTGRYHGLSIALHRVIDRTGPFYGLIV